jgi:hypothetical protein
VVDNFVKIVEAIAHLISAFAWPAVGLVALKWLLPTIRSLFADKTDVSLTGWGWAITAKHESREAIALAEASKIDGVESPQQIVRWEASVGKTFAATRWLKNLNIRDKDFSISPSFPYK